MTRPFSCALVAALFVAAGCQPAPVPDLTNMSAEGNAAVQEKLDRGHVPTGLNNVSVKDFFLAVARANGVSVDGLGRWSERLHINPQLEPDWTTTQALYAISNEYFGKFGWGIWDGRLRVFPISRGEPLVLEDHDNITVQILADQQTVSATDKHGSLLWQTNVVEACGPEVNGPPKVWQITPGISELRIDFRQKAVAAIDIKTGVARYLGSD